jgi:hypothetical protein
VPGEPLIAIGMEVASIVAVRILSMQTRSAQRRPIDPPFSRDLGLDFFRGLSLLMVFLIHTRATVLLWFTTCNYGFSDPAEAFVFISGYAAALAYGRTLRRTGWGSAARRILRQAGRIYCGHLILSGILLLEVAAAAALLPDPRFASDMHVDAFFQSPASILLSALRLQFRPANLDVLPLFVVLFMAFPVVLVVLDRWPAWGLAGSAALYVWVQARPFNLAGYPPGEGWFFNPFAWQFLFCLGALCGLGENRSKPRLQPHPLLTAGAVLVLGWSGLVSLSWHLPQFPTVVPDWLSPVLYLISKTNLAPVRLAHFLALAYALAVRWPLPSTVLASRLARPVIRCGQYSLAVFGLGVLLSCAAEVSLRAASTSGPVLPLLLGALGLLLLLSSPGVLARRQ